MYAHIDELNIPHGVTTIGSGAFSYSDIRKLNIPGSVETINEQITNGCSKLEYLIFEDSYSTINGTNHGYIGDLPSELLYIGRNFWDTCHVLIMTGQSDKLNLANISPIYLYIPNSYLELLLLKNHCQKHHSS